MTLPQLAQLNKYWKSNPPVHVMIAAYLGVKAKSDEPAVDDIGAFIQESSMIDGTSISNDVISAIREQ
jgi:hypothetical protein